MAKVKCEWFEFCNNEVDPEASSTYRYVGGWEHPREAGGTNALAVRKPEERWACSICIDKLRRGIDPGQTSLIA